MRKQNTIGSNIDFHGKGLHSGNDCRIILKPAPEDTGILFVYQKDGYPKQFISYNVENVVDTQNNISMGNGKVVIKTVEHVVSALYGLMVDNCIIECDSNEIPIMDGSSTEFVKGILAVGVVEQDKNKEELKIVKPIWVTHEDKFVVALPYNGLKLNYTISFPNSPIGVQTLNTELNQENYIDLISQARTFGFIEDMDYYQKHGLVLGGGFENVHVFSKKQNTHLNSPRYNDEPVRHKILDLIGGLAILNFDIKAFIVSYKGGHYMDVLFARKILSVLDGAEHIKSSYDYASDSNYYYNIADILSLEKIPS